MAVHSTYEFRWKNLKGFKDTGWIKIKPITILIGPNNAGKTSFLIPLLLMNQTLSSRDSKSPLVIKGNLFDGGNLTEIINGYKTNKDLFFGFRYHCHNEDRPKRLKKIGTYPPGAFEVTIGKDDSDEVVVKNETIYDMFLRKYLSFTRNKENLYDIHLVNEDLNEDERKALKNITPTNFLFTPNVILNAYAENDKADEERKTERFSAGFEEVLRVVSRNFSDASRSLLNLSYIGPLRDTPHRFYEITDEKYQTVGQRGENTAYLLKSELPLIQNKLNKWIKKFGFGDSLSLNNLYADLLYSITFNKNNSPIKTNISNTGFGASQILPLVVQALISKKESITIAEQPEIHLNPKLQGVLAELFGEMAKNDQRVIVETHSEHLILRLRTLIAKKKIKPEWVSIYFVENKKGASSIKEIGINANGEISSEDWPEDFFDDTLKESLALASQQAINRRN